MPIQDLTGHTLQIDRIGDPLPVAIRTRETEGVQPDQVRNRGREKEIPMPEGKDRRFPRLDQSFRLRINTGTPAQGRI